MTAAIRSVKSCRSSAPPLPVVPAWTVAERLSWQSMAGQERIDGRVKFATGVCFDGEMHAASPFPRESGVHRASGNGEAATL